MVSRNQRRAGRINNNTGLSYKELTSTYNAARQAQTLLQANGSLERQRVQNAAALLKSNQAAVSTQQMLLKRAPAEFRRHAGIAKEIKQQLLGITD